MSGGTQADTSHFFRKAVPGQVLASCNRSRNFPDLRYAFPTVFLVGEVYRFILGTGHGITVDNIRKPKTDRMNRFLEPDPQEEDLEAWSKLLPKGHDYTPLESEGRNHPWPGNCARWGFFI
ncbi:hypothetical protein LWH94_17670 [Marinobacter sp. G11]|uniref:hypothetical protein n=1 Tax=Marinobacter sp. G11 TaxID=2903522 RepID=UPI001E4A7D5F|nr:hypothetical protein [Marinobacter sp. G11]MCE0761010.1 hypothetical protein [Marinobacter sp. G11]